MKLNYEIIDVTKYDSLKKLIIVTSYVIRFVKNLIENQWGNARQNSEYRREVYPYCIDEYNHALKLWITNEHKLV